MNEIQKEEHEYLSRISNALKQRKALKYLHRLKEGIRFTTFSKDSLFYLKMFHEGLKECEEQYPKYRKQIIILLEYCLKFIYSQMTVPKSNHFMTWLDNASEFIYKQYFPEEYESLLADQIKPTIAVHNYMLSYIAEKFVEITKQLRNNPEMDNYRRYLIHDGNYKFENEPGWLMMKLGLYTKEELEKHPDYKKKNFFFF